MYSREPRNDHYTKYLNKIHQYRMAVHAILHSAGMFWCRVSDKRDRDRRHSPHAEESYPPIATQINQGLVYHGANFLKYGSFTKQDEFLSLLDNCQLPFGVYFLEQQQRNVRRGRMTGNGETLTQLLDVNSPKRKTNSSTQMHVPMCCCCCCSLVQGFTVSLITQHIFPCCYALASLHSILFLIQKMFF